MGNACSTPDRATSREEDASDSEDEMAHKRMPAFLQNMFEMWSGKMLLERMQGAKKTQKDNPMGPIWDFREKTYDHAIVHCCDVLQNNYVFTQHKKLDFGKIKEDVLEVAIETDEEEDYIHYWNALLDLQASIPDGHFKFEPSTQKAMDSFLMPLKQSMGGSFGFAVLPGDDGVALVVDVVPGSEAEQSGVEVGQRVLAKDGIDIAKHVAPEKKLYKWAKSLPDSENPATTANMSWHSHRFVTRGAVGSTATFNIEGVGELELEAASDADGGPPRGLIATALRSPKNDLEKGEFVLSRKLDNGLGYLSIISEPPEEEGRKAFKDGITAAFESFADCPGLIIDLRSNHGGFDALAAWFSGAILPKGKTPPYTMLNGRPLYEQTKWINSVKDLTIGDPEDPNMHFDFPDYIPQDAPNMQAPGMPAMTTVNPPGGETQLGVGPFYVEPLGLWNKPIVCITNADTISSGDGMVRGCANAGAKITGFTGTSGSFGMDGAQIWMPGNGIFYFPFGQAVDAYGSIMLDSDSSGHGGTVPTHPTPRTAENYQLLVEGNLNPEAGDEADPELLYAMSLLRH